MYLDPRLPEWLVLLRPLEILADEEGGEGPGYRQPHQDAAAAQALQSCAEHCVELLSTSSPNFLSHLLQFTEQLMTPGGTHKLQGQGYYDRCIRLAQEESREIST